MSEENETNRRFAGGLSAEFRKALSPGRSEQIRSLQASEALSRAEVALRFTVVMIVGIAVAFGTGEWVYAGWAALYVATDAVYLVMLQRTRSPVDPIRYATIIGLNTVSVCIYASFAIYVWSVSDDHALQSVAVAALIAHIVFNITRHTLMSWPAILDILTVVVSIAIVSGLMAASLEGFGAKLIVLVAAACLALYYVQAHVYQILERGDLARRRQEAMEQQKDSAIGQITAGIAHDFNNILTAIQGNIDLADLTSEPREKAEFLDEARKSTQRASDIVASLMAYVGKSQLRAERLSLDRLQMDIRSTLSEVIPNTMRLTVDMASPDLTVAVDREKLLAALRHLGQNSVEASPDRQGEISLTLSELCPAEWPDASLRQDIPYVLFLMRDDGPGIPDEELNLATDPFFTTKPKGGGAGLGLAMVKGFVKQSGGYLRLRNSKDGGLEAALILPARVLPNGH